MWGGCWDEILPGGTPYTHSALDFFKKDVFSCFLHIFWLYLKDKEDTVLIMFITDQLVLLILYVTI